MFKDKIKALREQHGLTKKEIAKIIDVSERAYITYEYGQREPSMDTVVRIANHYGVTTDYLLGREQKDEQPDPLDVIAQRTRMETAERAALEKWLSLNKEHRESVLQIMRDIIKAVETADAQQGSEEEKKIITMIIHKHINRASAGCGYDLSGGDEWEEIEVIKDRISEQADFAVEVDGDSMLPEYKDGDVVYIVLDSDVPVGKVGLFRQNGKGYIKERGKDYLISANPDYPSIYPADGEIECIGRVIGVAEIVK